MDAKNSTEVQADQEKNSWFQSFRAPNVSLPKGGGAIRSIGEKFAASPVTGTGSMSVPIATSPGRSGFGPQLTLSYDSGAGNGPFGFGWSLSLPSITRKTDKGLPKYHDAIDSDVFVLSGAEDLVPVLIQSAQGKWERQNLPKRTVNGLHYRVDRYRPRIEGLFARIERWTNTTNATDVFWRSISHGNITTWYGRTPESRIADSAEPTRIFSWLICQSHDDKGNVIVYSYKHEDSAGIQLANAHERNRTDQSRLMQRYLKRIRYGNSSPYFPLLKLDAPWPEPPDALATDGSNAWRFEAVFDYGEHDANAPTPNDAGLWPARQDPFSSYRSGFEVRTYRICQRVLMFHHFPNETDVQRNCLVRSTDLTYSNELNPTSVRNPVYTFLQSLTQTGYRRNNIGYDKRSLPPVEFEYTQPVVQDKVEEVDAASLENLPTGVDGSAYQWTDLHGEGIPGILTEQADAWYYKRNLSPVADRVVEFAPAERVASKPNLALAGGQAQFMDLAGGGQPDLVVMDGPTPGFFEHDLSEGWQSFRPFISRLNRDMRDPNIKFIDLDGDGHADVFISEDDAFIWHASLVEEGFGEARRIAHALDEEHGPRLVFDDGTQSIYLADLGGDGLTDLVRIRNGEVCYWPSLGYGYFGAKVTMDNSPWFDNTDQFDHQRVRLADIDGSGATDIIYLHRDGVRLYFNQSGNSWSEPQTLQVFPRVDDLVSIVPADLLGNGTACLVWSSVLSEDGRRPMRYVNLMGGQKPHLLVKTINNMGAETRVHYASSTKFYLQDKRDGKPWVTKLPFPVHVVERVETLDHISQSRFVTRYAYHHGCFDGSEREFRGFGMVEQWDTEQFNFLASFGAGGEEEAANIDAASHVPPVLTKTWFHTGMHLQAEHISNFLAGLVNTQDRGEYYREPGLSDPQATALLLPDTVLPSGLSIDEERQARRSLKGAMLRQEVYALDGAAKELHPYSVTEQNFTIRLEQPRGENRHAVFFSHPRESITYHYERNPTDPRIAHSLTLAVDEFGNVLKSAAVAYGRRQADPDLKTRDQQKQGEVYITYGENGVTNKFDTEDYYRTPLPCESQSYELTGLTLPANRNRYTPDELLNAGTTAASIEYGKTPTPGLLQKRLIEHVRTYYRSNDLGIAQNDSLALLPLGTVESLALPGEAYKLAFTPGLLSEVYGPRVTNDMLETEGCYVHTEGDNQWWIPSGRTFFSSGTNDTAAQELIHARATFFLSHRFRNPFHSTQTNTESVVSYDDYHLLVVEARDALANTVRTQNDYRLLAPHSMTDPNGNRSEVAFDVLGMVVATAVKGKVTESLGDLLEDFDPDPPLSALQNFIANPRGSAASLLGKATTRVVYDLERFQRAGQPPFAATLARETHFFDGAGSKTKIQVGFAYSDGFGREIQKKVQAEQGDAVRREPDVALPSGDIRPGTLMRDANGKLMEGDASPRWVGNGRTIFNNKGKPVKQYEPFFSATHLYEEEREMTDTGVTPILFYDPAERVVATLHPNHTWQKVVFDPWRQESWDVNDTALIADPKTDADVGDFFRRLDDDEYLPTWHALRTDPNHAIAFEEQCQDAALRTNETQAATKTAIHANTPSIAHADSLGRTFLTVAHNKYKFSDAPLAEEFHRARIVFDIEGNQREVSDVLDRKVMLYDYDMLGTRVHQASMEAGQRWMLNDSTGKPIRAWDSRGHNFTTTYDALRRPLEQTVRGTIASGEAASDPRTLNRDILVDKIEYGENTANAGALNLRTRIYRHFDSAGVATNARLDANDNPIEAYDFKGSLLRSTRRLIRDYKAIPDWLLPAEPQLEAESFESSTRYDALNRPIQSVAPHSNLIHAKRNVIQPVFNHANLLERVDVWLERSAEPAELIDPTTEAPSPVGVANVDYDAKGQRLLIDYKNDASTFYNYDPLTFRLTQLLTKRKAVDFPGDDPQAAVANWPGKQVQNLHYAYDPVGNITHIHDDAQQTIYFSNQRVEPSSDYSYDAVYRLIEATGREHLGQVGGSPIPHSYNDSPRVGIQWSANDGIAMGTYAEQYFYDEVGNFKKMHHERSNPNSPAWTRVYGYNEPSLIEPGRVSNRLSTTTIGLTTETYSTSGDGYDAHGNMLRMPQLQIMQWDFRDQLQMSQRQAVNADDADGLLHRGERTYYLYDANGQRSRKVTERQNGTCKKERIYLGGFEVYREYDGQSANVNLERETLHVTDDKQRIALVETCTLDAAGNDQALRQLMRYQFGNYLGSASLELDEQARIISYEEYTPYGSSSYQAVRSQTETAKRYRYTGMERDDESGLNYHGARYYAAWLGRWTSCDPVGLGGGMNLYRYAACAPTTFHDPTGTNPHSSLTVKQQAAIAENAGQAALERKYSTIDTVKNITPPSKNVSANGVDAHLIVGKGANAINVIGDTKYAGMQKDGGLAPVNYTGKEKPGHVSSFDAAAKNNYAQLRRNIGAALKAGKIDRATAYHASQGAKAGLVLHEIVVTGRTTGVSDAIVQRYQASVTRVDNFAETVAKSQSLDVKAALGKSLTKLPATATLMRWFTRMLPGGGAKPLVTPPLTTSGAAGKPPTATPPGPAGIVKLHSGMPGTIYMDPAPRGLGGTALTVAISYGPQAAVGIAKKAGASETVVEHVGFWSSVAAGGVAGGLMAAPGGVTVGGGIVIGGVIGGVGYLSQNYELCLPFYNCSD